MRLKYIRLLLTMPILIGFFSFLTDLYSQEYSSINHIKLPKEININQELTKTYFSHVDNFIKDYNSKRNKPYFIIKDQSGFFSQENKEGIKTLIKRSNIKKLPLMKRKNNEIFFSLEKKVYSLKIVGVPIILINNRYRYSPPQGKQITYDDYMNFYINALYKDGKLQNDEVEHFKKFNLISKSHFNFFIPKAHARIKILSSMWNGIKESKTLQFVGHTIVAFAAFHFLGTMVQKHEMKSAKKQSAKVLLEKLADCKKIEKKSDFIKDLNPTQSFDELGSYIRFKYTEPLKDIFDFNSRIPHEIAWVNCDIKSHGFKEEDKEICQIKKQIKDCHNKVYQKMYAEIGTYYDGNRVATGEISFSPDTAGEWIYFRAKQRVKEK